MNKFHHDAKSSAGSALAHVKAGEFGRAVGAIAPGPTDRRSGMAALILAANITPEEQAALRAWLDERDVT